MYTQCDTCDSKEKLHSLLQITKPTKNNKNMIMFSLLHISKRFDTFSLHNISWYSSFKDIQLPYYCTLALAQNSEDQHETLNKIYHDLNMYILISDDDQPNLKKQFDQY